MGSCTPEGDQEFCCGLVLDTKSLSEFPHQLSEDSGCRTGHLEPLPCPGRGGWCPVGGRAGRGTGGWCQPAPLSWHQSLSPGTATAGDQSGHHACVLLLHLPALLPPPRGASPTFFPPAQAIQSDSRSIRLILTLEVAFFSFILITDMLKLQILHLLVFRCSKVPKKTRRTYFRSC